MKKRIYIRVLVLIVLFKFLEIEAFCQSFGNIVNNPSKGYISVGAESDFVERNEEGYDFTSTRYIGKIEVALNNSFSFIGYAGASNIKFTYSQNSDSPDFQGSTEFCFGGGFKKYFWQIKPAGVKFFGSVGFLKLWSFDKIETVLEDQISIIDVKFNWYEYWIGIGTVISFKNLDFYAGIETKSYEREEVYTKSTYSSGFKGQMFFGVDFKLPFDLTINLQGKLIEEKSILIGLSQKGTF